MSWKIEIERVNNGYVIKHESEMDETIVHREVIEDIDTYDEREQQAKTGEKLLWYIIEYFGLFGSKYDKYRLRVAVEPGHAYVDLEQECPLYNTCNVRSFGCIYETCSTRDAALAERIGKERGDDGIHCPNCKREFTPENMQVLTKYGSVCEDCFAGVYHAKPNGMDFTSDTDSE